MIFLGDVHGESPLMAPLLCSAEDTCVQVGDFGFLFREKDGTDNAFLNDFESSWPDKRIFVIPGNHENYDLIEKFPLVECNGALSRQVRENIYYIERGEILNVDGLRILCCGGADSLDKAWRRPQISWWPQEVISNEDVQKTIAKGTSSSFDMVCSHAMPTLFMERRFSPCYNMPSDFKLEQIYVGLEKAGAHVPLWVGGHVHIGSALDYNETLFRSLDIGEALTYHKGETIAKFLC